MPFPWRSGFTALLHLSQSPSLDTCGGQTPAWSMSLVNGKEEEDHVWTVCWEPALVGSAVRELEHMEWWQEEREEDFDGGAG